MHILCNKYIAKKMILKKKIGEKYTSLDYKYTYPIMHSYTKGTVEDLKMDPSEAIWSINIKKGLISLLKVRYFK